MLDSLASYWNTIIPYRQNTAYDGMHIRKCAWLDSTTLGETKNVPLQGNRHGRFELHLYRNMRIMLANYTTCRSDFFRRVLVEIVWRTREHHAKSKTVR